MKIVNNVLNLFCCLLFQLLKRKSMFAELHSDINFLKSGFPLLTDQTNSPKSRAKAEDGIISGTLLLGTTIVVTDSIVREKLANFIK
jgi:hypothetical protein